MADDVKNRFPIKSGGYFPRRYLVPRHRAQTLYSVPFKANNSTTPELELTPPKKISAPPLRLRVEQLINSEFQESNKQTSDSVAALTISEALNEKG